MCDTFAVLAPYTADSAVLFGKNSDRCPNEPHQMFYSAPRTHKRGALRCTYISIPQVRRTYGCLLFKPSWIWGCEMAANDQGLCIGNEAVFTRFKHGEPSLIGMDYVRLVAERCRTAREGVELIAALLAQYGQGGNCGFDHRFEYDNSYLIADREQAWVVETAGRFWAARQVRDVAAISNCLSIEHDYDLIHSGAVQYAVRHGWCRGESDFSFARCFTEPVYTHFSRSHARRRCVLSALREKMGALSVGDAVQILQSHSDARTAELKHASVDSVCMHAGGLVGDHTTGSLVASLEKTPRYFATGASTPCFSLFKPLFCSERAPIAREDRPELANAYWLRREHLFRTALAGKIDLDAYRAAKDRVQAVLLSLTGTPAEVMSDGFKLESEFVRTASEKFAATARPRGTRRYRRFWKKKTAALEHPHGAE